MSVPRIARIHLVYQFIILTLLIFAISYNEILPDKRFLFLALVPIFCYQLIIVFCCTELLPLPSWLSWTDTQNEVLSNQESNSETTGSVDRFLNDISKSPKEPIISLGIPRARLSTKKKETTDSAPSSDANTQTTRQNSSGIFKKVPAIPKTNARRSESTKSYAYAYRENKFEECSDTTDKSQCCRSRSSWRSYQDRKASKSQTDLKSPNHLVEEKKSVTSPVKLETLEERSDTTDNSRCCRSRSSWRSYQDRKASKSQTDLKSPNNLVEGKKSVTSPVKLETLEESIESDLTDLSRSYSFPFRQRKLSRRMEMEGGSNDLNIPVMPAWNAIDYFGPISTNRRRKSISTEAIDRELRLINSHFEQNAKNDFTQSMEVASECVSEPVIPKKGLKSSASFIKWRQGIANYFNKTKRESINIKAEGTKLEGDGKKPFLKDLFSSKEFLYQGPEKKAVSTKSNSQPFTKSENRKLSNRSPSYISYEEDYYLD